MIRGLNRLVALGAALLMTGCTETPMNEGENVSRPKISAADERRLEGLRKQYKNLRAKLRVSGVPSSYLELQQDRYVMEEEIERIEPLDLVILQMHEDNLDRKFRVSENTKRADRIVNEAKSTQ